MTTPTHMMATGSHLFLAAPKWTSSSTSVVYMDGRPFRDRCKDKYGGQKSVLNILFPS
jgi:hypothetical protein